VLNPFTIPRLPDGLRTRTLALASEHARIVDRIVGALSAADGVYARAGEALQRDIRDSVDFSVKLWFSTVLSGVRPSEDDLATVADFGRRRVYQGVPLASLLGAYRLGSREIWSATIELAPGEPTSTNEALFDLSLFLLEHFDLMARVVGVAYQEEEGRRSRWRETAMQQLVSIILSNATPGEEVDRLCHDLGLDPSAPRAAMMLDLGRPKGSLLQPPVDVEHVATAIARHLKVASGTLVRALHRGQVVIWFPMTSGDTLLTADAKMVGYAQSVARVFPGVRAIGTGLMHEGAAGWAASAREAASAVMGGRCRPDVTLIYAYSDIAMSDSVLRCDSGRRYLNAILQRLALEPELLATLRTFLESKQHRKQAATTLGIHPNTLAYRLERIEKMLDASLDDASWLGRLDVVIQIARTTLTPD
jgi:carbohydrate diacid regulator